MTIYFLDGPRLRPLPLEFVRCERFWMLREQGEDERLIHHLEACAACRRWMEYLFEVGREGWAYVAGAGGGGAGVVRDDAGDGSGKVI